MRVHRGAGGVAPHLSGYVATERSCRAASRSACNGHYDTIGFRVVMTVVTPARP
jgi:hypothetical protein